MLLHLYINYNIQVFHRVCRQYKNAPINLQLPINIRDGLHDNSFYNKSGRNVIRVKFCVGSV